MGFGGRRQEAGWAGGGDRRAGEGAEREAGERKIKERTTENERKKWSEKDPRENR